MREIKFRAWNRIVERMQEFSLQDIERLAGKIQWQNLEIMQFTGLKDKKKNDVYESDILILPDGNNALVVWDNSIAGFALEILFNSKKIYAKIFLIKYADKIGNKFEHSHLLVY